MANLLTNGTFASGMASWTASPSGVAVVTSGEAVLTGSASATHQLLQSGFAIASGTSYHFTAQIRGLTGGKQLRAELVTNSGSSPLGLSEIITTTTGNVTVDVTFTASATTSNARLRFRLINQAETAYIDNVVLETATSITAGFTGTPLTGTAPTTVTFTNTSTGSPTGYNWEYSKDGGAWTSFSTSSGNPTNNFTLTGSYGIRLTVTKTTETNILTRADYVVISGGIVAGFTGTPTSGAITLSVTFTDASTATNGITSREWFYNRSGAGWTSFSTSTNPVYGFTLGGVYDIRLTIVGPDGTSTFDRLSYITATGGVVAGFTGTPFSGAAPLTVAFTDASSGTIVSRIWEYSRNGGAWTEFSSSTNPSFQFNSAGIYSIRLTVTGSSTSDTLTISEYIVASGTDTISVTIYDEGGQVHGELLSTFAFQPETDYYIVASYDKATGYAILYVNGAEEANANLGSTTLHASAPSEIHVGQLSGSFHSNILIDELLFLNRAINPDEVRAVYESNAPVFAETSTWHWRAGRNRLWADAEGLWMVNASGTKVLGAYAGDENDANAFKTWGGVNLYESDVLIGDASRAGYIQWDDSAGTLKVSGEIVITAGNAAKIDFSNITATLDAVPDGSTRFGSSANQISGADRAFAAINSSNVIVTKVIPATTIGNPSVAGLYLGSDRMGYHTGNGATSGWKTYMDNSGNMLLLGNASNNYIQWVAASNKLQGVGGGVEQWYADATDGKIKAGNGDVILDVNGIKIKASTSYAFKNSLSFVDSIGGEESRFFVANSSGQVNLNIVAIPNNAQTANRNAVVNIDATPAGSGTGQINLSAGTISLTGAIAVNGSDIDMNGNDIGDIDVVDANSLLVAPVSTSVEGVAINMPTSTTDEAIVIKYNSTVRQNMVAMANANYHELAAYDNGSGGGPSYVARRNSNGSTPAAGHMQLDNRAGTAYTIWVDNTGVLRLHTATPTNANDVAGTIVGSQSSWIGFKTAIEPWADSAAALDAILATDLYSYQFRDDDKVTYYGLVITEDDRKNRAWYADNLANNQTPVLNERNLFGYLIAAIQEQQKQIEELRKV